MEATRLDDSRVVSYEVDDPYPGSLFDLGMPEDIGPDPDSLTEEEFEQVLGYELTFDD